MKAILVRQFGGPEVLKLEDLADPLAKPGHVVVRVKAAGVNPVDTYIRAGKYAQLPELPYIPGQDAAGDIESVGSDVPEWRVGDRVFLGGSESGRIHSAYAQRMLVHHSQLNSLPERVTFQQGAAVNIAYVTAYRALFDRGNAQPGEVVLIHGATGGVGTAAVQLAAAHGCTVIGTGGTDAGRDMVRKQGARYVLDHKSPTYLDELKKLTNGRGPDVIIEMLANVNLDKDLGAIAPGGRIVVVGNRGRVEIDARQTMPKESVVTGMNYWGAGPGAVVRSLKYIVAGLASGTLSPIVGKEMPLADAAKAHVAVMEAGSFGKVVLLP